MEILYYLSSSSLILFMILATWDGFYLHIWKYELFKREESRFEHKTHAIRALLFPLIIWLLFINQDVLSFWFGIAFVLLDMVVLGIDAYSEKDSRKLLGGLPRWEYILHLFANGFHLSAILLYLGTLINVNDYGVSLTLVREESFGLALTGTIAQNIIPGAVLLALVHFLLLLPKGIRIWTKLKGKITCC